MTKKFLFISGCDRSGTTALVNLLNSHPKLSIGMERYKGLIKNEDVLDTLNPKRFETENFFNIKDEETNIQWKKFYDELKSKYDTSLYVGDKVPRYFQVYSHFKRAFPEAKHIAMIRSPHEVANSWKVRANNSKDIFWSKNNDVKQSIKVWNKSLEVSYKAMKNKQLDMLAVNYSSLFCGNKDELIRIMNFLNIESDVSLEDNFIEITASWADRKEKKSILNQDEIEFINNNANFKLLNHFIKTLY